MLVAELEGALLDYWVAKAGGSKFSSFDEFLNSSAARRSLHIYSSFWAQGGPIIERERISINYDASGRYSQGWRAFSAKMPIMLGDTPLIAAMRCYVATKYGDEVPDMEEV